MLCYIAPVGLVRVYSVRSPVICRVTVFTALSTLKEWMDTEALSLSACSRVTCRGRQALYYSTIINILQTCLTNTFSPVTFYVSLCI